MAHHGAGTNARRSPKGRSVSPGTRPGAASSGRPRGAGQSVPGGLKRRGGSGRNGTPRAEGTDPGHGAGRPLPSLKGSPAGTGTPESVRDARGHARSGGALDDSPQTDRMASSSRIKKVGPLRIHGVLSGGIRARDEPGRRLAGCRFGPKPGTFPDRVPQPLHDRRESGNGSRTSPAVGAGASRQVRSLRGSLPPRGWQSR